MSVRSPVVVLCHAARPSVWEPVLPALIDRHDVTFLDVPGFGDAPMPAGYRPGIETMATGVRRELAERGLSHAGLVGLSMAGAVALEVARLGEVRAVLAVSPAGFWTAAEAALVIAEVGTAWTMALAMRPALRLAGRSPTLRRQFWRNLAAHPERLPESVEDELLLGLPGAMRHVTGNPRTALAIVRDIVDYRVRPLPEGSAVTVAWGDHDRFTPYPRQAERAQEVLPHARHVTLRGCGHIPTYDDPDQVAHVLLESLVDA